MSRNPRDPRNRPFKGELSNPRAVETRGSLSAVYPSLPPRRTLFPPFLTKFICNFYYFPPHSHPFAPRAGDTTFPEMYTRVAYFETPPLIQLLYISRSSRDTRASLAADVNSNTRNRLTFVSPAAGDEHHGARSFQQLSASR